MSVRLGEVLIRRGVLTSEQVDDVLLEQQRTKRPFGLLAEQMFGIPEVVIEQAWAEQYASITGIFDLEENPPEREALGLVSRRQAWQFSVLPITFDGHELVMATTRDNLPRALRFATRVLERPCFFVLADSEPLADALNEHYPMPGMKRTGLLPHDHAAA